MTQSPQIPILMYHKVERATRRSAVPGHYVSPSLFRKQMSVLSALGYSTIPLSHLQRTDIKFPRKPIVITFDDGYENFYTNALPILKSQNFVATVFLVGNQLGGTNVWDHREGDLPERLMDIAQIGAAHCEGTEFGSHTLDHADLSAVSAEEAWKQIDGSKRQLERDLGFGIETFCYPYGRKNPDVMRLVERAGYRLACSTEKGLNSAQTPPYNLKRINIRRDTSVPVFVLKLIRGSKNA